MTETQLSQLELSRTAENFRKLHQERQNLLKQWESAVQTMRKRDEEITEAQTIYERNRDESQSKRVSIMQEKELLDIQTDSNEQLSRKIELLDRSVAKSKTTFTETKTDLEHFQDELSTLKMTLQKSNQTNIITLFYSYFLSFE